MSTAKRKTINPKFPGSSAADEISHALDLLRAVRLALHAGVSPGLITDHDIASLGYVLNDVEDLLQPAWKAVEEAGL